MGVFGLRHSALRKVIAIVGLVGVFLAVGTPSASAQDDDPYGSTTTTTEPTAPTPSCSLSVTQAEAGASVTATVFDVPLGATVRLLFGGVEVGQGTASDTTTVPIAFNVPVVDPGEYLVTAVGDTFAVACGPEVGGLFTVLADTIGTGGGGGTLPRTGVYAALLVAVAVALLVVGRTALESSRRRQRRAARAGHADARHLARTGSPGEHPTE